MSCVLGAHVGLLFCGETDRNVHRGKGGIVIVIPTIVQPCQTLDIGVLNKSGEFAKCVHVYKLYSVEMDKARMCCCMCAEKNILI